VNTFASVFADENSKNQTGDTRHQPHGLCGTMLVELPPFAAEPKEINVHTKL